MKKSWATVSAFCAVGLLIAATGAVADDSNSSGSSTTGTTSSSSKHSKKKVSPTPTVQATATVQVSPTATAVPKAPAAPTPMASSPSSLFTGNGKIYDRVGAPGDLQKALAVAAKTTGSLFQKHDRSVFLWLGKVSAASDADRPNAYIRFSLDGIAFVGPKKNSLVLTGVAFDQSGGDCKAGDPIEVAVDFRDIKVDYEGTKLGEVNKGNDISDQVFDILSSHPSYQWVLIAQEDVRDPQDSMGMPTFVVKAKDGYAFLQPDVHAHSSASDR